MVRSFRHGVALLAVVTALVRAVFGQQAQPTSRFPAVFRYGEGRLVAGEWTYDFHVSGGAEFEVMGKVTGFALSRGGSEIAYCTAEEGDHRSALWVLAFSREQVFRPTVKSGTHASRLLWTAPAGEGLRGPIWWAPDGSRIALRSVGAPGSGLVVVDYLTGAVVSRVAGAPVLDAAWRPGAQQIAYVTEADGRRQVWLHALGPASDRQLGEGGYHLRWSLDGNCLRWLSPLSPTLWVGMEWDGQADTVRPGSHLPARPPDTIWSPDGTRCATLTEGAHGGGKQLTIYAAPSTTGELVPLPGAHVTKLLGWSPDSNLVTVLGTMDLALAVSARPPVERLRKLMPTQLPLMPDSPSEPQQYSGERALLFTLPLNIEAGPPSWSGGCDIVAYVSADEFDPALPWAAPSGSAKLSGRLVLTPVRKRFEGEEPGLKDQVATNLKHVATGLLMYLTEYDGVFPPVTDAEGLRTCLEEYVVGPQVFVRPGTEDEVMIQYLMPPGARLADLPNPAETPVVVADFRPRFRVVAYADGHVQVFEGNR